MAQDHVQWWPLVVVVVFRCSVLLAVLRRSWWKQTFSSVPVFKLSIANHEDKTGSIDRILNGLVSAAESK
jgi:hypothetical protein